jgi:outer membrane murein-binding lipoprotein Lpp
MSVRTVIVLATIAATTALAACRKEVPHKPMKLGGDVAQEQVKRWNALAYTEPHRREAMKKIVVLAAVVSAVALGACRKEVAHKPMKLGAEVATVKAQ